MSIRPGRHRHKVTFQRQSDEQDDWGEEEDSWTNLVTTGDGSVRCSIEPLVGRELENARGQDNETTHKIRLRWRKALRDLRASDRAVDADGTVYDIQDVIDVRKLNRELVITCVAD